MNIVLKSIARNYIRVFFITLLSVLSIVFIVSYTILASVGEQYAIDEIVRKQHEQFKNNNTCLYDSALNNISDIYKLEIYKYVRPDILVLGSSRVLQFRPNMFSVPMVNAGGGMGSVAQGYQFLTEALKEHRPKHIIMGVDFWWFNEEFDKVENIDFILPQFSNSIYELNNYLLPFKWLYDGKINIRNLKEYSSNCHFGAIASERQDGYGPFGSYYYNSVVFGKNNSNDEGFKNTLRRIEEGNDRFQYGAKVSQGHYENFIKLMEMIKEEGLEVTIIFPPLASIVYEAMKNIENKYAYVWELEDMIINQYDGFSFHDSSLVSVSDCEFIDGFHGGDVVYARILNNLKSKRSELSQYINIDEVTQIENNRKGNAYDGHYDFYQHVKEIDFLKLNCRKN